jgi:glycerol-3-phosphate dehydrogenase
VLDLIEDRPALGAPIAEGFPHVGAEVVLATREEFAASVDDVLLRRTRLGHLLPDQGRLAAAAVASLMAAELGWSAEIQAAQAEAYRRAAGRLAPPAAGDSSHTGGADAPGARVARGDAPDAFKTKRT